MASINSMGISPSDVFLIAQHNGLDPMEALQKIREIELIMRRKKEST